MGLQHPGAMKPIHGWPHGGEPAERCLVCGFGHEARRDHHGPVWREPRTLLTVASGALLAVALLLRFLTSPGPWETALVGVAILLGAAYIARDALLDLIRPSLSVDFLMLATTLGAFLIGDILEAASIVVLYSVAEILEDYSEERVGRSIEGLMALAPRVARAVRGGGEEMVPIEELAVGQTIAVKPGEKIPMDGRVLRGASAVDEATLTGESVPAEKIPGSQVFAGTVNQRGYLEVEVTHLAKDNTITRIIHLVESAEVKKARSQRFVERFSLYYTPTVVAVAILAAVALLLLGASPHDSVYTALILLLVSCPCALVISTPVTMVSAITSAARRGVLVKGGVYLEEMARVDTLVLDKTGTVTLGQVRVQQVTPLGDGGPEKIVALAAALENHSEHPLAGAILQHYGGDPSTLAAVEGFEALPGLGVEGTIAGTRYLLGNLRLLTSRGVPVPAIVLEQVEGAEAQGRTVVLLATGEGPLGLLTLEDQIRPGARAALRAVKGQGILRTVLLTGDTWEAAGSMAATLGVDEYHAKLLPGDKADLVTSMIQGGARVAAVGDGVNDAPALATAQVGIAMGAAGSYIAMETADIALMGDDLGRLPYLLRLARTTRRVIQENVAASVGVKAAFFLLTLLPALLLAPPLVTLWMAVLLGDLGTSLAVIGNALRLARL